MKGGGGKSTVDPPMLRLVEFLARILAMIGGLVLLALVILTCASVLGRGLNTLGHADWLTALSPDLAKALLTTGVGPINGDFELVEAGIAFAIFAFLPICQLYGGHATVDVFTRTLGVGGNRLIMAFWEVVLALAILLLTWRLFEGLVGKYGNGETTFLLQFPVWWAYGASFLAGLIAALVSLYCAFARIAEAMTGERYLPKRFGADH